MAGSVTQTRSTNIHKIKSSRPTEVIVTLACVGDASDGSVPAESVSGLSGYRLTELTTLPGAAAAQPDAYPVTVSDSVLESLGPIAPMSHVYV